MSKNILNPRTVRVALARANKRLEEIEASIVELQAKRDTVNQLRAALEAQLPVALPELEGPALPGKQASDPDGVLPRWDDAECLGPFGRGEWTTGTDKQQPTTAEDWAFLGQTGGRPDPQESVPGEVVEVGDCFWATGAHQHRISGDIVHNVTCLAPEDQIRKP